MSRDLMAAALLWPIVASIAAAQGDRAVVELFEDDSGFFIQHLDNHGAPDASVVDRSDQGAFSGACALSVTPFQRFNTRLPGWKYQIAKEPEPGQFRYLRFAWKRTEAPAIMLQIHAEPNRWHRYYAGTVSEQTQAWGAMTRVAETAPRKWELVTRDLFADFGPMTITGIGLTALEGPGVAYFDHIYLGRTIEALDRVTAARKNVANEPDAAPEPEPPARTPWLFWAIVSVVLVSLAGFLGAALVLWLRGSKPHNHGYAGKPPAKLEGTSAPKSAASAPKKPQRKPPEA